jgi:hypothetical protein
LEESDCGIEDGLALAAGLGANVNLVVVDQFRPDVMDMRRTSFIEVNGAKVSPELV